MPVPVNQQPTAYSDSATTAYQTPVDIDLITNDIDLDGSIDASSAEVTTHPINGIVTINASNGVTTYTPNDGFSGADSFEYRVSDTEGKWSEPVAVNLLVEPLARNFTYLEESGGMYYQLSEPVPVTGDFEWESDVYFLGDVLSIFGNESSYAGRLRIGEDGAFNFRTNSSAGELQTTTGAVEVGKYTTVNLKRVNGNITLSTSAGFSATHTNSNDLAPITCIGRNVAVYSGGMIANCKLWLGGDRNTGTLTIDAPLDDHAHNKAVYKNNALQLGPELADGSFPAVSSNWTVSNGVVEKIATDSNTQKLASVIAGNTYIVSFRKDVNIGGQPNLRDSTGEQYLYPLLVEAEAEEEVYTYIITPTLTGDIGIQGNYATFRLTDFSIKEVINDVPVISTVNVTEDEVTNYTFNSTSSFWLSDNLTINGGFDTDTNWKKGAGITISGGVAQHDGGESLGYLYQNDILLSGGRYLAGIDALSDGTGFSCFLGVTSNSVGSSYDTGRIEFEGVSEGNTLYFRPLNSTPTAVLDNATVQHILEVV
ncbi:Ig-like domain-containing protein [Neptunomonas phycophila]|uniref:Ig-like domain-containing protein n=1 Tax=Neptunomonas phycophila TaxID=1572645 RepID=UPI00351309AD